MAKRIAIQQRYNSMYGWSKVGRSWKAARAASRWVNFSAMFIGFGSMLKGVFVGIASKLAGLVALFTTPFGALAGILTVVIGIAAVALWKFVKRVNGATDAQIRAREMAERATEVSIREITKAGQWYRDELQRDAPTPGIVQSSTNHEMLEKQRAAIDARNKRFSAVLVDKETDSSAQTNEIVATKWANLIQSDPLSKLALGDKLNELGTKGGLTNWSYHTPGVTYIWDMWWLARANKEHAKELGQKQVQAALMMEGGNDPIVQQAVLDMNQKRHDLAQAYSQLQNKSINQTQYDEILKKYNEDVAAIKEKALSHFDVSRGLIADGMTPEKLGNTTNWDMYIPYMEGAINVINANFDGDVGTYIGKINAYQELRKNQYATLSEAWNQAIAKVAGDFEVTYKYMKENGTVEDVKLMIETFPTSGKINMAALLDQLRKKLGSFKGTLQAISDIAARFYQMLVDAGLADGSKADEFVTESLNGVTGTKQSYLDYYDQYIGNDKNSEWVKGDIDREQYATWMTGGKSSTKTMKTSKRSAVTVADELVQMKSNIARHSVKANSSENKNSADGTEKKSSNSTTPTTPSVPSQDRYASSYNSTAEAPKVINFNIHNVASFDRTAIASSAEERDIMAQMEGRIANAVYNIFTMAAQQANSNVMA